MYLVLLAGLLRTFTNSYGNKPIVYIFVTTTGHLSYFIHGAMMIRIEHDWLATDSGVDTQFSVAP